MTAKLISIWLQVQQLPRAARWGVYGVTIIVVLYVYAFVILEIAGDWDNKADQIAKALNEAEASNDPERVKERESVIRSMGPVKSPATESVTSQEMHEAVNQVLRGKVVSKDSFVTESPTKMKSRSLEGLVAPDERAESITGRLEFESSVDTAVDIIAQLEASPAIEAVKSVRLTKLGGTGQRISVKLELEAWVVSRTTASLGAGNSGGGRR